MTPRPGRRAALLRGLALALAGCEAPKPPPATLQLARPSRLLVRDFYADPKIVVLDRSVRAPSGQTDEASAVEDLDAAQRTTTQAIVYRLQQLGLQAVRAPDGAPIRAGDMVVDGHFDHVDEGDRTKLAGRSGDDGLPVVAGVVTLSAPDSSGALQVIARFSATSADGRVPGAPGGTAARAAALAGGGVRARELLSAGVSAEARRLGNDLADQLKAFMAQKGWIGIG